MAIIHDTTMSPGKLELLASWLPAQPWYSGRARVAELSRAGGFRLDDPAGEVGIEFMIVTDGAGGRAVSYQVPMTYRAAALAGAGAALIGTAEHGVLGRRWIYDGTCDPVLAAQLVALIQGDARPQAQRVSNTVDPTVTSHPVTGGRVAVIGASVTADDRSGTELRIHTAAPDGGPTGVIFLRVHRVLWPGEDEFPDGGAAADGGETLGPGAGRPCVSATWRLPDGTLARGVLASARYSGGPAARAASAAAG
jgi:maltokinase-like protein